MKNIFQSIEKLHGDIIKLNQRESHIQRAVDSINRIQSLERLEKYLLHVCEDTDFQKGITKEFLRVVEIGIHSFCNRKCWFCANSSMVDRHSKKELMPEEMFLKIISELAEIEYAGMITFHRYNEPLADKELIIKRLSQVKSLLPNCSPSIFTNGDYIKDGEYLSELIEHSASRIHISLYLNKDEPFFDEKIIASKFAKFFARINIDPSQVWLNTKENRYECALAGIYCGKVTVVVPNFEQHAFTMAGTVDTGRRQARVKPCSQPFEGLWVDYHGYVMPCCMLRHEVAAHTYASLGNIHNKSLFELFCSKKMVEFRKKLKNYGVKRAACTYCDLHGEWMEKSSPLY